MHDFLGVSRGEAGSGVLWECQRGGTGVGGAAGAAASGEWQSAAVSPELCVTPGFS